MFLAISFFLAVSALAAVSPLGFAGLVVSAIGFGLGYKVAQLFLPSLGDED